MNRRRVVAALSLMAAASAIPWPRWVRAKAATGAAIPTLTPGAAWYASAATETPSVSIYANYGDRYRNEALPGSGFNPEPNQGDETALMGSGWPEAAVGGISIARLNRPVPNFVGYAGAYPIEQSGGRCVTAFAACGDPTRAGIRSVQVNFEGSGWVSITRQSHNPDDGTFGYVFRLATDGGKGVFGVARFYVRLRPVNGAVKLLGPFDVFMNDHGVFDRQTTLILSNGRTARYPGIVYCDPNGVDSASRTGSRSQPFATPNFAMSRVADGGYVFCNPSPTLYVDVPGMGRFNTKPIVVIRTPGTAGTVTIGSKYQSTLDPRLKGSTTANRWSPTAMHAIYRDVSLRILCAFCPFSTGRIHLQNVNYRDPDGTDPEIGGCYGPDTDTYGTGFHYRYGFGSNALNVPQPAPSSFTYNYVSAEDSTINIMYPQNLYHGRNNVIQGSQDLIDPTGTQEPVFRTNGLYASHPGASNGHNTIGTLTKYGMVGTGTTHCNSRLAIPTPDYARRRQHYEPLLVVAAVTPNANGSVTIAATAPGGGTPTVYGSGSGPGGTFHNGMGQLRVVRAANPRAVLTGPEAGFGPGCVDWVVGDFSSNDGAGGAVSFTILAKGSNISGFQTSVSANLARRPSLEATQISVGDYFFVYTAYHDDFFQVQNQPAVGECMSDICLVNVTGGGPGNESGFIVQPFLPTGIITETTATLDCPGDGTFTLSGGFKGDITRHHMILMPDGVTWAFVESFDPTAQRGTLRQSAKATRPYSSGGPVTGWKHGKSMADVLWLNVIVSGGIIDGQGQLGQAVRNWVNMRTSFTGPYQSTGGILAFQNTKSWPSTAFNGAILNCTYHDCYWPHIACYGTAVLADVYLVNTVSGIPLSTRLSHSEQANFMGATPSSITCGGVTFNNTGALSLNGPSAQSPSPMYYPVLFDSAGRPRGRQMPPLPALANDPYPVCNDTTPRAAVSAVGAMNYAA